MVNSDRDGNWLKMIFFILINFVHFWNPVRKVACRKFFPYVFDKTSRKSRKQTVWYWDNILGVRARVLHYIVYLCYVQNFYFFLTSHFYSLIRRLSGSVMKESYKRRYDLEDHVWRFLEWFYMTEWYMKGFP